MKLVGLFQMKTVEDSCGQRNRTH